MYKSDRRRVCVRGVLKKLGLGASALVVVVTMQAQQDPGVRAGAPQAGGHLAGLSNNELTFFNAGQAAFNEIASVSGTVTGTEPGLGPRFNLDSCAGCHAFPAVGGSSPAANPQVTRGPLLQVAVLVGLGIIRPNGPVREVRFKSDGGVHDLFTIAGRNDRPQGCNIGQPAFLRAVIANDAIFRVPTPTFGAGLIEAIDDSTILANVGLGASLGITGRANRSGNDGSITRFGWKAQNKSLVIFSGEAYNVEQGITNELFPDERGEGGIQDPAACRVVPKAQDLTHFDETTTPSAVPGDAVAFANFMRFLAAPAPASSGYTTSNGNVVTAASISRGQSLLSIVCSASCRPCPMTFSSCSSKETYICSSWLLLSALSAAGNKTRFSFSI